MIEVGVHEAKTRLVELLRLIAAGERVIITSNGTPVAQLVPLPSGERRFGMDAGLYVVPGDFDAPLPGDFVDLFEQ